MIVITINLHSMRSEEVNQMNIGIVEDDAETSAQTSALLTTYQQQHHLDLTWTTFASAEALLFAMQDTEFDLLLLDIRPAGRDGVTLAKTIRSRDANIAIAFLSNYEQYVFDGYDVDALAYIMKPLTLAKLTSLIEKAQKHLQPRAVMLSVDGVLQRVYLYNIRYVEANGHYLTVHTQTDDLRFKGVLDAFAADLPATTFVRVHRAFIVNLNFVSSLESTNLVLSDDTSIPVARGKRAALKTELLSHYRGLRNDGGKL